MLKEKEAVFFKTSDARVLHNKLLLKAKRVKFFFLNKKTQQEPESEWERWMEAFIEDKDTTDFGRYICVTNGTSMKG